MNTDQVTAVKKINLSNFAKAKDKAAITKQDKNNKPASDTKLRSINVDHYQTVSTMSNRRLSLNVPNLDFSKIETNTMENAEELKALVNKFGTELTSDKQYGNVDRVQERLYTAIYNHILNHTNVIMENTTLTNASAEKNTNPSYVSTSKGLSKQTTGYLVLIYLPLAKEIAESNFMLAGEQVAINDSIGEYMSSEAEVGKKYTEKMIEKTKEIQKKLDSLMHKFSGFIGIAVGSLEIGMGFYTGLKSLGTGNMAGVAAGTFITLDGAFRLSAGTLVQMDRETKCFGGDIANSKMMSDMCLYGALFFMGDDAGKMQLILMTTLMTVGCAFELSTLADTVYGLCNTMATVTAEVMRQLTLMLINVVSATIGLVFAFKAIVESFIKKEQNNSLDPEQVTGTFGGRMGLLALIIDKSGLRNIITDALSKDLSKDNSEMVEMILETGMYMGLTMGNMYGNSVNQKNLSKVISESEVVSMQTKLQGKLPQPVLEKADTILNKIHQMVTNSRSVMSQNEIVAAFTAMSTYATSDAIATSIKSIGMSLADKALQNAEISQQEKSKLLDVFNNYNQAMVKSLQDLSANIEAGITNNLSIQEKLFDNLSALTLQR